MTADAADALARARRICLAFPGAEEKEAWGEPTFRVRDRIFAMYASPANHHGAGRAALWCKAQVGVQETLVRSDPARYFVPPYVGPRGWIGLTLALLDDDTVSAHVLESYALIAPKKLRALLP